MQDRTTGMITDGTIAAGDLGTDSVAADELASTAIQAGDIEAGDLPADGYAGTYVNITGSTMTGSLVLNDNDGVSDDVVLSIVDAC